MYLGEYTSRELNPNISVDIRYWCQYYNITSDKKLSLLLSLFKSVFVFALCDVIKGTGPVFWHGSISTISWDVVFSWGSFCGCYWKLVRGA